jgi:hypothetical protein
MAGRFIEAEIERLSRPDRQRALGGGRDQGLEMVDQLLMTLVWLRCYPKQHVLAYLFGVSESSVSRVLNRMLPLLAQSVNLHAIMYQDFAANMRQDFAANMYQSFAAKVYQ